MFGLGSPQTATTDKPPTRRRKKQNSRRRNRRRAQATPSPPETPDKSLSSTADSLEEKKCPPPSNGGGFLSNWTGGTQTKTVSPEVSQSEHSEESAPSHSEEHSDDEDGDESESQSSYDSQGSASNSHSDSSSHSEESSSEAESVESHSEPSSSRSSMRSPESSMQSSSIVSPESSMVSPESSMLSFVSSKESQEANKQGAKSISSPLLVDVTDGTDDKSAAGSPSKTKLRSTLLLSTNDGGESDLKLTVNSSDCVSPNSTNDAKRSAKCSSLKEGQELDHLVPPKLASASAHTSQDADDEEADETTVGDDYGEEDYDDFDDFMSEQHSDSSSGDEADDELTMFTTGDDTFSGEPVDPVHGSKPNSCDEDVVETDGNLESPTACSTRSESHQVSGKLVGPNPTSSTLQSASTQIQKNKNEHSVGESVDIMESEEVSTVPTVNWTPPKTEEDSVREIGLALEKAKEEYETGSEMNRRYNPQSKLTVEKTLSQQDSISVHTPSFLNRHENFHKTASAAVAAMLTPRSSVSDFVIAETRDRSEAVPANRVGKSDCRSDSDTQLLTSHSGKNLASAFHPPSEDTLLGRRSISELISFKTEQKLESLEHRMTDPTKTTEDLLVAIATPEDSSKIDLGYMVRRKNACGAIKVMTNDSKKRIKLCWTVGVLQALTSVLTDSLDEGFMVKLDKRIRFEYEAARNRAITTLLNLSMPKENRIAVFHTPRLMQAIIFLIKGGSDSASRGCTAILAYLAKSIENRLLMAQIPGFVDALVPVLVPKPPRVESRSAKTTCYSANSETRSSDDSNSESQKTHSIASEDSQKTLKVSASQSPIELFGYDETADPTLRGSRQNVFALLGHLSKEKDNAYHFARETSLVQTMVQIATFHDSPCHVLAVKFLANLTRHRQNTKLLVFQEREAIPALIKAANSESDESRLYACFAIQNLAQDSGVRQELAGADGLVKVLCRRGRYAQAEEERLSAVTAIKNLCDEPANLIPLTNTPECIATLMHLAHGREDGVTEIMQYRACDALATLSHWLRKIATSGKALDATQRGESSSDQGLFVPSLRVVTWNQWQ
ncbi:hypothetical protein MPSEU_000336600 [Mayamaea pseudoterrestris]|nr:hypothetical protein MPSEU_000336600 [Mayamaea pseudoterrestris]